MLVGRDIRQLWQFPQPIEQLRGPFAKLGFIGILQGVLKLRAADARLDLHVLHGLHEQGNACDIFGGLAEALDNFPGAGLAFVARFETDVQAAGIGGGVDRSRADERSNAHYLMVFHHDVRNGALPSDHGFEGD